LFDNIVSVEAFTELVKVLICQTFCREFEKMEYLSASELLKWEEINDDAKEVEK